MWHTRLTLIHSDRHRLGKQKRYSLFMIFTDTSNVHWRIQPIDTDWIQINVANQGNFVRIPKFEFSDKSQTFRSVLRVRIVSAFSVQLFWSATARRGVVRCSSKKGKRRYSEVSLKNKISGVDVRFLHRNVLRCSVNLCTPLICTFLRVAEDDDDETTTKFLITPW